MLKKGALFIPLIFSFASKLENVPLVQYYKDPTKITTSLKTFHDYFQTDGIVCYLDPTLEAEALGCTVSFEQSPPFIIEPLKITGEETIVELKKRIENIETEGRIPVVLDVIRRLGIMIEGIPLVGVLLGPFTLASKILNEESTVDLYKNQEILDIASSLTLSLTRLYGEAGLDLIIYIEKTLPKLKKDNVDGILDIYSPIWNSAKFYEMNPTLMLKDVTDEHLQGLVYFDSIIVNDHKFLKKFSKVDRIAFSIPVDIFTIDLPEIFNVLEKYMPSSIWKSRRPFFVTTSEEIPYHVDPKNLIDGIKAVKEFLKRRCEFE